MSRKKAKNQTKSARKKEPFKFTEPRWGTASTCWKGDPKELAEGLRTSYGNTSKYLRDSLRAIPEERLLQMLKPEGNGVDFDSSYMRQMFANVVCAVWELVQETEKIYLEAESVGDIEKTFIASKLSRATASMVYGIQTKHSPMACYWGMAVGSLATRLGLAPALEGLASFRSLENSAKGGKASSFKTLEAARKVLRRLWEDDGLRDPEALLDDLPRTWYEAEKAAGKKARNGKDDIDLRAVKQRVKYHREALLALIAQWAAEDQRKTKVEKYAERYLKPGKRQ